MTSEPVDRSRVLTEQRNPETAGLHRATVAECLQAFQREDRRAADAVVDAEAALASLIEAAEPGFVRGGRLVYLGAGTSGRLGVLDASEAPPTFDVDAGRVVGLIAGGDSALRKSSESAEDDPNGAREALRELALTADDTVIAIAAGGSTPYALGGLVVAKESCAGVVTALLACTHVDPEPPSCDYVVELLTGPEVLTGSTRLKAGTATKLALNAISTTLMVRAGRVYDNLMVDLRATNAKLRDRAARIIGELTDLERDAAFELLDRADGEVKVAVAMDWLAADAEEARARLDDVGGRLERLVGEG